MERNNSILVSLLGFCLLDQLGRHLLAVRRESSGQSACVFKLMTRLEFRRLLHGQIRWLGSLQVCLCSMRRAGSCPGGPPRGQDRRHLQRCCCTRRQPAL